MTTPVDAFDLPEWLGEGEVTWTPECGIHDRHLVPGFLTGAGDAKVPCALLAVDEAYPTPVADEQLRHESHQAWRHGQVHLVSYDGSLTLAVPGRTFTAELVLEVLSRLAKAVGARPESYAVLLRLGS
ncbi:hypothetical protein ISU10_20430 [Nocardioides agariphilus]|jgi:hypothetical protein|uniref:Uncharacterized protein n=1 Tax=Nocardioides agariphilus TaxID=433664 RepID=A0A930VNR7_9ACTN|nr:hypothetical protein [Nocardioides agariphilus]MBF4770148.1 hypothetical protein [Nocardioides agariphilus]